MSDKTGNTTTTQEEYFSNRELSWLQFNERVLENAASQNIPVLERLKFLCIFHSNLEEFFMVRVAGLKRSIQEGIRPSENPDTMDPSVVLSRVNNSATKLIDRASSIYKELVGITLPELGIQIQKVQDLDPDQQEELAKYFDSNVFPVLTPLAVDPSHPFPFLTNLNLYILIQFGSKEAIGDDFHQIAFVKVPWGLPRLVEVQTSRTRSGESKAIFVLLEDLIGAQLDRLFFDREVAGVYQVKVTRDLDFTLLENEVVDLLQSVQKEVINRGHTEAVRLELSKDTPAKTARVIQQVLGLSNLDVHRVDHPLSMHGIEKIYDLALPLGKFPAFNPRIPSRLQSKDSIFSIIDQGDLLLHHPYESFYAVIEFITAAVADPDVLAIKQTLYRTSGDSPIIEALKDAARNGKQVTAVVELKARFDEQNNISWARQLERAGVNVVYGFIGLKTHAKAILVTRRSGSRLKNYIHLSTGNYNSVTAKVYEDCGYLTTNPEIGHDVSILFNMLTGFNIFSPQDVGHVPSLPLLKRLVLAPIALRKKIISELKELMKQSKQGKRATFNAKMNALVDKAIIKKLYEASAHGVEINLVIRGICCLRPQVPGLSENIRVVSIVDRFLEHSRIYQFTVEDGMNQVYLSSADLMPRNMDRRVEILFPIEDPGTKERLASILATCLSDNDSSWELQQSGEYKKRSSKSGKKFRAQESFIEQARELGVKSLPYEMAIRHKGKKKGMRPIDIKKK